MAERDRSRVPDYFASSHSEAAAVVFGAGNGIGRQAAHALAQAGKLVLCVDIDDHRAKWVAGEIDGVACSADVTRSEGMSAVIDVIRAEQLRIDCVVDVIGIAYFASIEDSSDELWQQQFGIVLDHARLILRDLEPLLVDGATITFVGSAVAEAGGRGMAAYAATKAGLRSLVQTAAVELAERNILVNVVAPGVVATPRMSELLGTERIGEFSDAIPLGRLVEPSEVAAALLFLALGRCRALTGQSIVIDGGTSARFPYPSFT